MDANNKTELGQILELLNKLDTDVRQTNQRFDTWTKQWDERYFQLVKEQGANSRAVIYSAATVVVFGILASLILQFTR